MPLTNNVRNRSDNAYEVSLASGARTASGQTGTILTGTPLTQLVFQVNVTAASGTSPTLVVKLQDTLDGTNWNDVAGAATSSITATGLTVVRLGLATTPITDQIRYVYTIGGTTPSFTFQINSYMQRV